VRLHEHPDFAAFVTAATAEPDLAEAFVEKDYWITEILRVIATTLPDRAIFKGGTSLLLESNTIGGFGRIDTFAYRSGFSAIAGFPSTVRLEPGIQSGNQPTQNVEISSFVADLLRRRGATGDLPNMDGLDPFTMTLLHFRRTFVEKLFALHGKVERLKTDGYPLGRDARHYADIHVLAGTGEVLAMLNSDEYAAIEADYDANSRAFFPKSYRPPDGLTFAASDALFPPDELRATIEADYERECTRLFFRPHPPFDHVLARLREIRTLL